MAKEKMPKEKNVASTTCNWRGAAFPFAKARRQS
jgi:hypothetical protein